MIHGGSTTGSRGTVVARAVGTSSFVGLGVMGLVVVSFTAWVLRGTRAWWIPGAVLLFAAVMMMTLISSAGGDVGGVGALGNTVVTLGFMGLLAMSLAAFAIGGGGRAKPVASTAEQVPEPELPLATVVRHRHRGA